MLDGADCNCEYCAGARRWGRRGTLLFYFAIGQMLGSVGAAIWHGPNLGLAGLVGGALLAAAALYCMKRRADVQTEQLSGMILTVRIMGKMGLSSPQELFDRLERKGAANAD